MNLRVVQNECGKHARQSHMKILLIEDDRETASFIGERLKGHGHAVDQSGFFRLLGCEQTLI